MKYNFLVNFMVTCYHNAQIFLHSVVVNERNIIIKPKFSHNKKAFTISYLSARRRDIIDKLEYTNNYEAKSVALIIFMMIAKL